MSDEDILCVCIRVTVADIKKTVQAVQDITGVGTVCGICTKMLN